MLRPYQARALQLIRQKYAESIKKVLLSAPTGSGKTVMFCVILSSAASKGKYAIMVVRGRQLVEQASRRLDREGIDHGILMAGHWRVRPNAQIQLCSIDTLYRRKQPPKADIIVIDEAHHATSDAYKWLATQYPQAFFLSVTATPHVNGSLRHVADVIVKPVSIKDLVQDGFLVGPKYYAPSVPDLTGVKTSSGDFLASDLDKILNKTHPIGDVVSSWFKHGENRPTILFAVSINHSRAIVEAFNQAGVPSLHVDADSDDAAREEAIKLLESGKIKILSNVGILCTGVDIPSVSCIVSVRPTKSYALYIQQMGRGTRVFDGKKDFIVIDHGGNVLRHGCILEEREGSLDPIPKQGRASTDSGLTTCKFCYAVFERQLSVCPGCSAENESANSRDAKANDPIKARMEEADPFHLKVIARRGELRQAAKRKGFRRGWIFYRLKEEFGEDVANKYEPKRKVPAWVNLKQKVGV